MVRFARRNSPVRSPTSNGGNVLVWHFSKKMGGRFIELESNTVEGEAACLHENDVEVLAFYSQPFRRDLLIKDSEGRVKTRQPHTPDFLRVMNREFVVEEWREESRLLRLAAEGDQFYKDENGWHFRAAEADFAEHGLRYHLRSAVELPHVFIQNARFLQDYHRPTCPPIAQEVERILLDLLAERGSIPFEELIRQREIPADEIFKCIVHQKIAVNLEFDRLDRPAEVMIHRDMAIARAYRCLVQNQPPILPLPGIGTLAADSIVKFDGKNYRVALVGGGSVLLQDQDGRRITLDLKAIESMFASKIIEITPPAIRGDPTLGTLADYSKEELERAEKRLTAIETGTGAKRSLQRWRGLIDGKTTRIERLLALVDDRGNQGNTKPRLPDKAETLAKEAINKYYNTPEGRNGVAVFNKYQDLCEPEKTTPMSYESFMDRIAKHKSIRSREGARKQYQVEPIPLYLDYRRPLHGVYPHDVTYIDSTVMTMATLGINGAELGKPRLTFATDGHTTEQRAMYMSYDPPSAAVVLMTLRDYVRRNGKLPRVVVADSGPEHDNRELRRFCNLFGIDLRLRKGKPRGGAAVESALGATEKEVFAQIEGNTRIMRNTRMVTQEVDPFRRAKWTLTATHGATEDYLFNIRQNRVHPTLGVSPKDYCAMRLLETGNRAHTMVRFDEDLLLLTSPHSKHWYRKVDLIRGVWADNMYYWNDSLRGAKKGEKVEVRVEPWNANVIYVYFRDKWIAAIARDLRAFAGRHRREVELAIREERRLAKVNATNARVSRVNAKKMLELWSPEKFDERIGLQQREMAHLYQRLGMTTAMGVQGVSLDLAPEETTVTSTIEQAASADSGSSQTLEDPASHEIEVDDDAGDAIWEDTNGFV